MSLEKSYETNKRTTGSASGKSSDSSDSTTIRMEYNPLWINLATRISSLSATASSAIQRRCAVCEEEQRDLPIQSKLTIGTPHDQYELEADAVAERVMRMPALWEEELGIQPNKVSSTVQRKYQGCHAQLRPQSLDEEEEDTLQTKRASEQQSGSETVSVVTANKIQALCGGGRPLSKKERSFFEPRFRANFSGVRVHDNARAADAARSVNARAFTLGNDVVFGQGEYASGSEAGRRLLAHELVHVRQQSNLPISKKSNATLGLPVVQLQNSDAKTIHRMVSEVIINCADSQIYFQHDGETTSYSLDHCEVSEGSYDASVSLGPSTVNFDLGEVSEGTHFDFHYSIGPGQANPNTFFVGQSRVRIVALNTPGVGIGTIIFPVSYEATPMISPRFSPSSIPVTLGIASHFGAMGDLSWLAAGGRMRWGDLTGRRMWSSFFTTEQGMITLDRVIHNPDVFSRLDPRIVGEMRTGGPYSWVSRGLLTEAELLSLPELVQRLNIEGVGSLSAEELFVLRRAAEIHIGGSSPGAPFASYSLSGETAPFLEGAPTNGRVRYRVRVLVDNAAALDVSAASAFTHPQPGELGNFDPQRLLNAEEFEVLVTAGDDPRLVSVQRVTPGSAEPSWMVRNAGTVRWAGRGLLVLGAGMTAHRIAAASPEERPRVVAIEAGGWGGGFGGAELGVGACIAFGIATEGFGLLLCGIAAGIGGGALGSYIMGSMYDSATSSSGQTRGASTRAPDGTWIDYSGRTHMGRGPQW